MRLGAGSRVSDKAQDVLTLVGSALAVVGFIYIVIEVRVRGLTKRVSDAEVAHSRELSNLLLATESGRLASNLVDDLLVVTELQNGLLHRILSDDARDLNVAQMMASISRSVQKVRRTAAHLDLLCGSSRARTAAAHNLRGAANDVTTLEVLQVATTVYPEEAALRAAYRSVKERIDAQAPST